MLSSEKLINWFEIPTTDLDRAMTFYKHTFQIAEFPPIMEMNGMKMAFFTLAEGSKATGGALVHSQMHTPSTTGVAIYFDVQNSITEVLSRVVEAGGEIIAPEMSIGEFGHIGWFKDSEGNAIGLHSA